MGKKEKLIKRLKSRPKDFTFEEAVTLLEFFDYIKCNKGKTSGSRVMFEHKTNKTNILLHRPHPRKELLEYQVKQLVIFLQEGQI